MYVQWKSESLTKQNDSRILNFLRACVGKEGKEHLIFQTHQYYSVFLSLYIKEAQTYSVRKHFYFYSLMKDQRDSTV